MNGAILRSWATDLLENYPPMMTLHEVAEVLNIEPRSLRTLARHPNPQARIVATKINSAWRFPRDELAAYLTAHENRSSGGDDA